MTVTAKFFVTAAIAGIIGGIAYDLLREYVFGLSRTRGFSNNE